MLKRQVQTFSELGTKTFYNIFLVASSFVWYFAVLSVLDGLNLPLTFWIVHFCGLIGSAIVGATLGKVDRKRFLVFWITLSMIATITLPLLNESNPLIAIMIGLFLGASFGFGMPACMGLFTDSIPIQNRGRASGLTILVTGIGIVAFSFLPIEGVILVVALAIWRMISLMAIRSVKWPIGSQDKANGKSFKRIIGQRSFVLYFVPWLMLSLVNYLPVSLMATGGESYANLLLVQTVSMGVFAIVGGFLADSVGRKRVAIAGFTLLGVGTAVLGISQDQPIAVYFNAVVDGIAWGFLLVLFIVTLWGDLSYNSRSDKYYAIGVLPFFMSKLIELTIGDTLQAFTKLNAYAFFSFTAFFLFIAVLPLVYAPETLPDRVMKDRDLKSYVEKAQKQVSKVKKKQPESKGKTYSDSKEESKEYKKAQELAEKYY